MEKPKDLLIIDPPNELRFCGPFTRPVITVMKLTNPTDHTILFKIKTTAPKRYCVRPNFGAVAPHSNTKVEICLQAFVYDANEKNKHKFMVQSLIAPEGVDDYGKLWRVVEPDQLMDAKLKCVFEMPAVAPPAENSGAVSNEVISKEVLPKTIGDEKPVDQSDKIAAEIQQLRQEGSELRKENLNLKEQIVRLRCSSNKQTMNEPYSPMVEKQIPMFYIALSIIAAIFGILLGKFLL